MGLESQRAVDDGAIVGLGLIDVVEFASNMSTYAARVAGEATPPPQRRRCPLSEF
jgi:hypothetical protein